MNETSSKNALSVYVSTCRLALLTAQDENLEEQNVSVNGTSHGGKKNSDLCGSTCANTNFSGNELARQLTCLRQILSCTICGKIAVDPVLADDTISKLASLSSNGAGSGGTEGSSESTASLLEKNDAGSSVGNHAPTTTVEAYNCRVCATKMSRSVHVVPHLQGRLLIQCYRKLCQYLESTNFFRRLGCSSSNGGTIADLICEGSALKEDYQGACGYSNGQVLPTVNNNHSLLSRLLAQPPLPSLDASPNSTRSNCDIMVVTTNGIEPPSFTSSNNMYSVSLTGSTHSTRITIKRKQSGGSSAAASAVVFDGSSSPSSSSSSDSDVTLATLANANVSTSGKVAKLLPDISLVSSSSWESSKRGMRPSTATLSLGSKRKGCRCGNATLQPGKITCCGQRCPCYVEGLPCDCCKCKGCRNPTTASSSSYGTSSLTTLESRMLRNQRLTTSSASSHKDDAGD